MANDMIVGSIQFEPNHRPIAPGGISQQQADRIERKLDELLKLLKQQSPDEVSSGMRGRVLLNDGVTQVVYCPRLDEGG